MLGLLKPVPARMSIQEMPSDRIECERSLLGGPGPGATGMRRGCRLGIPGNQAHAGPALLTFSVHSSCWEDRRQCRLAANSATVLTHSPAIVVPADLPAAELSPRQGAGKGSARATANQKLWVLSSASRRVGLGGNWLGCGAKPDVGLG